MPKGLSIFTSLVRKARGQTGVNVIVTNVSGKRLTLSAEDGGSRMSETVSVNHDQMYESFFHPKSMLYFWQQNKLIGECQLPPQHATVHIRIGPGGAVEFQ